MKLLRVIPVVLAFGVAITVAACGGGEVATPSDPVLAKGQKVYNERCAQCHGTKGQGGTGMKLGGGAAAQKFPDIQAQLKVIREGRKGTSMAAWGGVLPDDDIQAVARYEREVLPG